MYPSLMLLRKINIPKRQKCNYNVTLLQADWWAGQGAVWLGEFQILNPVPEKSRAPAEVFDPEVLALVEGAFDE